MPLSPRSLAGGPRQLFANTPAERVALARTQFFEEGVRPSGLVGEAVIQSWMRCARSHADTRRTIAFDAVTPSRLHATLARNHALRIGQQHPAVGAALPLDPSVHTPDALAADERTDVLHRAGPRAAESAIERREG